MKNRKPCVFVGIWVVFALAFTLTACGGKSTLIVTNIPAEYKGRFIAAEHMGGDYAFAVAPPSGLSGENFKGARIAGSTVKLNAYARNNDTEKSAPLFTGNDKIYASELVIILIDDEYVHIASDDVYGFINTKLITLKNGSAKINFTADMRKL